MQIKVALVSMEVERNKPKTETSHVCQLENKFKCHVISLLLV